MTTQTLPETFLASLFDALPQSVTWSVPEYDRDGKLVDYIIRYANRNGGIHLGLEREELVGKAVFSFIELAPALRARLWDQYTRLLRSGEKIEDVYFDSVRDKYFHVVRSRVEDGILTLATDITGQKRAELEISEQAELIEGILDASINGVLLLEPVVAPDGTFTDLVMRRANKRFEEISGVPFSIAKNSVLRDVFPGLETESQALYYDVLRSGNPRRETVPYHSEEGTRWYDVSIVKMGNCCVVTYNNVTELRAQQAALAESYRQSDAILNAAQTRMILLVPDLDENGRLSDCTVRLANRAYANFKGTVAEALVGAKASALFPAQHLDAIFSHYQKTLDTGAVSSFDLHCDDPGRVFWVDVCVTRLDKELLVTINDYTRQRLLQLELEQKIKELERSNRNLEEFAYAASHDLKEPIRKVRFFVDRLREQQLPAPNSEAERTFSRVDLATERMRDLVDDLLDYAQVSLRRPHIETVPLNDVLQAVLQDLDLDIEQKKALIVSEPLPVIAGNARQLEQLFQNLLGNALKYHRADVPPQVRISVSRVKGYDSKAPLGPEAASKTYELLAFTDNGIGFERDHAERIFQVFQRLHGNSEYRGTGVGLSIARKVVENHAGFIYAEAVPGQGATFFVGLPASD